MKLKEQSYYPFGLQIAVISDQALEKLDSKNKFNGGVELEEDYGVNLYSTFYRKYDPQIGRFSGVDILSEKSINVSAYQFALNDPIRMNDPFGSKQTQTSSGGGQNYSSEWEDIFNTLYYGGGGYGGKWLPDQNASGSGYSFFSSDADAFMNGSMGMDRNNSWGNNGFANSFQNAQNGYYKNGGLDADVRALAPTVYLKGFSKQALSDLDAQIARNARMGFGDNNKNEESNGWETVSTVSETFDRSMVASGDVIFTSLAASSTLTKETFNMISEVPVLKQLGVVTSVVSLYNHGSNFIKDPNWKDGLEFLGNAAILTAKVLFPEATLTINGVEFIYNNVTTVIDLFDSKSD